MGELRHYKPGEPFTRDSTVYNAFVDAARGHKARQQTGPVRTAWDDHTADYVWVRNDSGYDCDAFGVLGLDDVAITPANLPDFQHHPVFSGVVPQAAHLGRFGILTGPLPKNQVGRACISGSCAGRIYVTDADDTCPFVDVMPGNISELQQDGRGAAQILFCESGEGVKWARLRLGLPGIRTAVRWFELKDALTPGGHATAYERTGNAEDGYVTDTYTEFEVYDVLGVYRGRAKDALGSPNDAGSIGRAEFIDGYWVIVALQPHALMIQCLANEGSGYSGVGSVAVDGVEIMQPTGALFMTDITTVENVHGWTGEDDDLLEAAWNEDDDQWQMIQKDCTVAE